MGAVWEWGVLPGLGRASGGCVLSCSTTPSPGHAAVGWSREAAGA